MTVVRMENETQQQIALQKPRDESRVSDEAILELKAYPEFAKKAYYSIPYKERNEGLERIVMIEGPSIKAAMALARKWGNAADAARIVDESDSRITVEGVFFDYQTNRRTLRTKSISRLGWSKQAKSMVPLRIDRLNIAIEAGMSKAVRNAILASLPVGLIERYMAEAKRIVSLPKPNAKSKPAKERIDESMNWFVKLGAGKDDVKSYINGLGLETDDDVVQHLAGLYTAIKDGQITIKQVFSGGENQPDEIANELPLKEPKNKNEPKI